MMNNISIIIPTLGNFNSLQRLIKSVELQAIEKDSYEVFVIVNGSVNEVLKNKLHSLLVLCSAMKLKVLFIAEKGVNRARNYGLTLAKYEVVLFLDDDCELQNKHFLSEHIKLHNAHPFCFATGGGYLLSAESATYLDEIYNYLQMKWYFSGFIEGNRTRYLLGGNFSIKSKLAKQHQLVFDESIIYGGSEFEFFKKAEIIGLEMLSNELDVIHHTSESFASISRKVFKQGSGKALIDSKFGIDIHSENVIQAEKKGISDQVIKLYLKYVFWTGYYYFQNRVYQILIHVIQDALNKFNYLRFRLLDKVSQQIGYKKDKGDRF